MKLLDETNKRYGSLVAIELVGKTNNGGAIWRFKCDCGAFCTFPLCYVRHQNKRDCGCKSLPKRVNVDFSQLIDKTPGKGPAGDCWIWIGAKLQIHSVTGRGGYGTYKGGKDKILAHRQAYIIKFGEIPEDKIVCHSCDTRLCVNPEHLFLGTYSDNTQDMIQKERDRMRRSKGSNHPFAILTENLVIDARKRALAGEQVKDLAEEYGVDAKTLNSAIHGRTWKHLPGEVKISLRGKRTLQQGAPV